MMAITTTDVLVVGAGPAGLTIATLLAHNGIEVRILDKKVGPTQESRALVVHAKTLELLDKLGLAGQAVEEGRRLGTVELFNKGKLAAKIAFLDDRTDARTPYPFILIYEQNQTEHLLSRSLGEAGSHVEWETELLELVQTTDGVQTTVRRPGGSEEIIKARWVIGADGAHSPVRHALSLGFAGETYEQTLFLADVDLEWTQGTQQVSLDMTRLGFNGFFPMPGGDRRFRLIGSLPPELAKRNDLTIDELKQLLNANSDIKVDIPKARWISVYRIHHRMAERFRVGHVFLVGDAAHIHSPAGGQGMNTGIGDAYNLAWKLTLAVKGHAHESLLDSYEAERMPFARAILNGSDRGFALQVTTNSAGQWLKLLVVPLFFRILSFLPLLRRQLFWLLSQLWTRYRNSPVVAESGPVKKGPRAGDRAPYGFFESSPDVGKSLFVTLGGLHHHLLLFAGRKPYPALADFHGLEEKLRTLLGNYEVTIHLHLVSAENRSLHARYGADSPSLFLIRPDGHIAYRGEAEDLEGFKSYLNGLFAKRGIQEQAGATSPRAHIAPEEAN